MAKDIFHGAAKKALEKDGWVITHDPYTLVLQKNVAEYEIDLGAEKLLAAEKGNTKIAVEVKSLLKSSLLNEFHTVLGQYFVYHYGLQKIEPDRILYLALPASAKAKLEKIPPLLEMINDFQIKIIYFNTQSETIEEWQE